jgi:RNA polymerase sigma-70 factor (ECF subfamily)
MNLDSYRRLRAEAQRYARRPDEIDDLLQSSLLAALEAGRTDAAEEHAWIAGVIRNQAAMQARSAFRRRRREHAVAAESLEAEGAPGDELSQDDVSHNNLPGNKFSHRHPRQNALRSPAAVLGRLPPAARRVAVLALHGMNAEEIHWILDLRPAAFRQRLTTIRKTVGELPPAMRTEALALAYVRDPARSVDLQFGLIRRALKAALGGEAGIGTHDADGHLIVVRGSAHTSPYRGNGSV